MTSPLEFVPLACPLDGLKLARYNNEFVCAENHTFDIARQGYVNLLPVQHKSSRNPGDSKPMVQARRHVLEQSLFLQLGNSLCETVLQHGEFLSEQSGCVIDAGCGEGYYTALLADKLGQSDTQLAARLLGTDISKWSIQAAARKHREVAFAVANNTHLPVVKGSAEAIISIFGFATWQPWSELQSTDQLVFIVDAGPHHLLELRGQIYPEVRIHQPPSYADAHQLGYVLLTQTQHKYQVTVDNNTTLLSLLEMTPHGRRTSHEQLNNLAKIDTMNVTIDALIRTYRRS